MKVAITGASGFVGTALTNHLKRFSYEVTPLSREAIISSTSASRLLHHSTFVHLAARVHQPGVTHREIYITDNVQLTQKALQLAYEAGIKHFVFLSTLKVYSDHLMELNLNSECCPQTPYGESKLMAEAEAISFCKKHKIALDIIRIPLVVGAAAKGNLKLIRLFSKWGIPLPLGSVKNQRSYLKVETLVEQLRQLCESAFRNPTLYLRLHNICESQPASTAELLKIYLRSVGVPIRIISIPHFLLKLSLRAFDLLRFKPQAKSVEKLMMSCVMKPGVKEIG